MLTLSKHDYLAIRTHGEETYPHECCGVLLGHPTLDPKTFLVLGNAVEKTVRAGNTRTDSAHNRYHIDPAELIRIQREARREALDVVGFYHSHPDHPARWSSTDLAEAHWLGCSYVITSVEQGRAVLTNSFLLTGTSEEDKALSDELVSVTPVPQDTEAQKAQALDDEFQHSPKVL